MVLGVDRLLSPVYSDCDSDDSYGLPRTQGTVTLSATQFTHLLSLIQLQSKEGFGLSPSIAAPHTPSPNPPQQPQSRPRLQKTHSELGPRHLRAAPLSYDLPRKPASCPVPSPPLPSPSSKLFELFPDIDPVILLSIVQHTFSPRDLYKLAEDVPHSTHYSSCASSVPSPPPSSITPLSFITRFYPTFSALITPLATYFQILLAHLGATHDLGATHALGAAAAAYLARLVAFAEEFHWTVILPYHMAFHTRQLEQMRAGSFAEWAEVDLGLLMSCVSEDAHSDAGGDVCSRDAYVGKQREDREDIAQSRDGALELGDTFVHGHPVLMHAHA